MGKVGIITFCDNTNYGSFLQTYALYESVKKMGMNVELIDYRKNVPDYEWITISGVKRIIKNNGYEVGLQYIINTYRMQKAFTALITKMMKKSKVYRKSTISRCHNKYDVYIVGSDLVWDLRYADDYTYMLDFADEDKRKISYAASYGYEKIPKEEKNNFIDYLSKFNQISVRELNAKSELTELLGKQIYHVCDPTMLLSNDFWGKFIKENAILKDKYVVVYMPDSQSAIYQEAKRYARRHRLKVFLISKDNKYMCPKDPIEFLNLLYYAQKVFTGSYHGLLFSVYFQKEFAFCLRKPSNRLETVSIMLGLEKYNIFSQEYDSERKVDYKTIKEKEQKFRDESWVILKWMLKYEER